MGPLKSVGIVAAVAVGYLIYPYYSLYQLQNAVQSGDVVTIEDRIDWLRLREGLKADLAAAMSVELKKKNEGDPADRMVATLGAAFSGPLISSVVDTNVTPAAIAGVVKGQRGKGAEQPVVDWAFFDGLTTFAATVHGKDGKHARLRFELEGFVWRLTRVYLPIEELMNKP